MESSTQGENGIASTSFSSLHPPPLHHTNAFLSPSASPNFDVDNFLLSRAPGSTLKEIAVDLQEYSLELKSQLNIVVDRDFKGFVSLGAALKAEGPRIARLDWKVATTNANVDDEAIALRKISGEEIWQRSIDTPKGTGGNLGLDRVRSEVVDVRDQLRKAEEDVRHVIRSKEEAEAQKANLMMLLSFTDSLQRLETLLLPPSEAEQDDDASSDEEVANDQAAKYWQAFSKIKEYQDTDTDSDSSDWEQTSDAKHQQTTAANIANPSKTRRRSSGLMNSRRRSSYGMEDGAETTVSVHKLNLPARIARASSEHAAFLFLRDRANAMGYTAFVAAHEARWIRVREVLKDDLRKLIATLTRYKGPSLLVGGEDEDEHNPYTKIARVELDSWTMESKSKEKQREEQTGWFESALQTWCELPPTNVEVCKNGASEAEETMRAALTSVWAREVSILFQCTI